MRSAAAVVALCMVKVWAVQAEVRAEPARPATVCGGEIVAIASGKPVDMASLIGDVTKSGGALIGERHGVRGHPVAAACLLDALPRNRPASLITEMLGADQQAIVEDHRSSHPEISDGLGVALKWWTTGWPPWPVYAPLFASAWRTRTPLVAGDLSKTAPAASPGKIANALGAAASRIETSWAASMTDAHCDLIDAQKAQKLARQQISRDMAMAAAVRKARAGQRLALLFAGRSHVRNDRSVGYQLRRGGGAAPVSIALFETATAGKDTDRAKVLAEAHERYDYVWFVGTADRPDACERLRAKGLIASPKSK